MEWISFQTRTLKNKYNLPIHYPNNNNNCKYLLHETKKDMKITSYNCPDLRIQVHLLHIRPNNLWEYPPEKSLATAFETYQCVITF